MSGNFTPYSYLHQSRVPLDGVEIVVSEHAMRETERRLFPASRHRSARIRKKLIKRFGGEFAREPCIFRIGDKILMHPERYAAFQREMQARQDREFMLAIFGGKA